MMKRGVANIWSLMGLTSTFFFKQSRLFRFAGWSYKALYQFVGSLGWREKNLTLLDCLLLVKGSSTRGGAYKTHFRVEPVWKLTGGSTTSVTIIIMKVWKFEWSKSKLMQYWLLQLWMGRNKWLRILETGEASRFWSDA